MAKISANRAWKNIKDFLARDFAAWARNDIQRKCTLDVHFSSFRIPTQHHLDILLETRTVTAQPDLSSDSRW